MRQFGRSRFFLSLFVVYFVYAVTLINLRKCKTITFKWKRRSTHSSTSRKGPKQVYKYYILARSRSLSGARHVASGCDRGYAKISDRNYAKVLHTVQRTAYDSAPNHGESGNARERTFSFFVVVVRRGG